MELDSFKTKVVFRIFKGELTALFPEQIHHGSLITCYSHVGQHSSADYRYIMQNSKAASALEYTSLYDELTSLGYNLKPVRYVKGL